ncbi:MAG: ion transporter [Clostridia bacterium]|nr:ion transporter [Clostridia bacterium]
MFPAFPAFQDMTAFRKRVFEIIEIGSPEDRPSRMYDFVNMAAIVANLSLSILYTFEEFRTPYGGIALTIEAVTVAFFALDYILRLFTAKVKYPKLSEMRALVKYIFSFGGLVDMLSFLPYYLPVFFPSGAVAFRMFRVARIFRLFRITAYHDSLSVITEVITSKGQQLWSSVFLIAILMIGSSLCMYSLENAAQPDVFTNAFSGIWWAVSTLLTVGYGDIYPITTMGKVFSIIITFLGVGMVAIPTGIISAGFVDQYSRIKRMSEYVRTEDVHFLKIHLDEADAWVGKTIMELGLPMGTIVAAVKRRDKVIVPRGNTQLHVGDTLVLGAESFGSDEHIDLKEVVLLKHSRWVGERIRDLDISRQTVIVMIKRKGKVLIPNGNLVMQEGDKVIMYTQQHFSHAQHIEV